MDIKIAISTTKYYSPWTLPVILPSLLEAGINPNDIHVFNGGFNENKTHQKDGINYHILNHNSYDYTALIEICEKEIEADYWFCTHDTTKVGNKFKELLYNIPENKPEKIALKPPSSMSIGTYRYDYLLSVRDKILACKNTDYTEEGLDRYKDWGVRNEDYILWRTPPTPLVYPGEKGRYVDSTNWYYTNTPRITEYFPSLDLYKNKANWQLASRYVRDI